MTKNHPYISNQPYTFWDKAVSQLPVGAIDPAIGMSTFKITPADGVMTMGSCFAQHVSQRLSKEGLNFLITENHPSDIHLNSAEGYGVFTARYGNVYTITQAVQLIKRCIGEYSGGDVWMYKGKYVDSYRPRAIPGGFESQQDLLLDRDNHLKATLLAVQSAKVLVFTLGLTEGWENATTRQVYPIAPGVAGGEYDPLIHKPFNMAIAECKTGLSNFILLTRSINPSLKIILTVSPVPLAATHTQRHVLTATYSSKSKLRVAAEEIASEYENVDYFPSYEIIQGLAQSGHYFKSDLREVEARGVNHVMKVFSGQYFPEKSVSELTTSQDSTFQDTTNTKILCDEDLFLGMNPGFNSTT